MENFILATTKQALILILLLSAPVVGVALLIGLIISLVQATTQIQEQTLTFVPKLAGVLLTLVLVGPWLMMKLHEFTTSILTAFPRYL